MLHKVPEVSWAHVRKEATIKLNPDPKIVCAIYICLPDCHNGLQVFKARGARPDLAANEEFCFGEGALDHFKSSVFSKMLPITLQILNCDKGSSVKDRAGQLSSIVFAFASCSVTNEVSNQFFLCTLK